MKCHLVFSRFLAESFQSSNKAIVHELNLVSFSGQLLCDNYFAHGWVGGNKTGASACQRTMTHSSWTDQEDTGDQLTQGFLR